MPPSASADPTVQRRSAHSRLCTGAARAVQASNLLTALGMRYNVVSLLFVAVVVKRNFCGGREKTAISGPLPHSLKPTWQCVAFTTSALGGVCGGPNQNNQGRRSQARGQACPTPRGNRPERGKRPAQHPAGGPGRLPENPRAGVGGFPRNAPRGGRRPGATL